MEYFLSPLPAAIVMVVLVLASMELGRVLANRDVRSGRGIAKGVGGAESVLFATLGLLIAFAFNGAASRFEARRSLVGQEANAVHTSWLRLELLQVDVQPEVRRLFLEYFDARLAVFDAFPDVALVRSRVADLQARQEVLSSAVIAALKRPDVTSGASVPVLTPMNQMFDSARTHNVALEAHPPFVIFLLLYSMAAAAGVFIGIQGAQEPLRRPFQHVALAFLLGLSIFVIVELEYPRSGLVSIEASDHFLLDVRERIRATMP